MARSLRRDDRHRDVIVVGSGFGAAMAAWPLVHAGADVLMLERGPWVDRGPHNWSPEGTITRTPFYDTRDHYLAHTDRGQEPTSACSCVGGPSVFYGAVSLRFREEDFRPHPEIVTDSGAAWPFMYRELEPWYTEAERILAVAGAAGEDPTEPPRSGDYPQPAPELSEVSRRIAAGAASLGLRPFRLPLAINFGVSAAGEERRSCVRCDTCDTFACAVRAKNDLATAVLPRLQAAGLELRSETVVTGLLVEEGRVCGVTCREVGSDVSYEVTADHVVLGAGALGTPHLLLASGLERLNPAGDAVGRYLMRHCSGIVFGAYTWVARHNGHFHKQVGIHDLYLGDAGGGPAGPLGGLQQTQTPNLGTVEGEIGRLRTSLIAPFVRRATGLLAIAEDRPQAANRVFLDAEDRDRYGLPRLRIEHHYAERDYDARDRLFAQARRIHRAAGALATYTHRIHTFSHALGTVRMGRDARTAPLAPDGSFRGVAGLWVSDGSALPTSAGVNPSLTIAANALRIGHILAERLRTGVEAAGERGP